MIFLNPVQGLICFFFRNDNFFQKTFKNPRFTQTFSAIVCETLSQKPVKIHHYVVQKGFLMNLNYSFDELFSFIILLKYN
ncbi:MAG: hypothetical protein CVU09_13680 [Bacteroidetes bacterium HGW-Bacteroidetes-4]|jgi:hypothetical protein|nr:MAG: hypothetical protein CVU09_13680 [Bacteroidetes bacterium HGW-Bacteroidetes-4]